MKVKTIDIQAKEWRDRVNGNSYFSAHVTLNYGMKGEKTIYLPFQYGYGNHAETIAQLELIKLGYLPNSKNALWHYCEENGIILRYTKQTGCLKRDVIAYGVEYK